MAYFLNSFEANLFQFYSMCFGAHSVIVMDFTEGVNKSLSTKNVSQLLRICTDINL